MNSETKKCQNCQKEFTIEPEDFAFYAKIKVPPPTFCPECRMIRRMMFRNERSLYKRKCDATGKEIISIYSLNKPFKVYEQKYWWSDNWDPMDYGRDYDFSRPFFEQFRELRDNFPLMNVSNSNSVNSEYCNVADQSKDCYLISAALKNENILYSNRVYNNKDSLDLYISFKGELCYENVNCKESYNLLFSKDCQGCINSYLLYDCRNCSNCFGCTNLRNKQYCIFNQHYSKEEYQKKIREFDLASFESFLKTKEQFIKLYLRSIHKCLNITKSIDSVGDNIDNSKNCYYCFDIIGEGAEDCRFLIWGGALLKDSHSCGPGIGGGGDLIYDSFDSGMQGSRLYFTSVVYGSHKIQYAFNCYNSSNLFGCIGLRHKQYCILNKQYTKEEYEKLVPKIIQHMNEMSYIDKKGRVYKYGEFFPPELSPFAYNETIAQEYFPLTKEQALAQGYSWKEPKERDIKIDIKSEQLPDHIKDVSDDIIDKVIECANAPAKISKGNLGGQASQCTTAFKIIEPELQFYRRMNLPLPRLCPNCRHYQRLKQRNPLKLWHRKCMCGGPTSVNEVYKNTIKHFHAKESCPNEFETTYSPERPEIVYCEQCYLAEVV